MFCFFFFFFFMKINKTKSDNFSKVSFTYMKVCFAKLILGIINYFLRFLLEKSFSNNFLKLILFW